MDLEAAVLKLQADQIVDEALILVLVGSHPNRELFREVWGSVQKSMEAGMAEHSNPSLAHLIEGTRARLDAWEAKLAVFNTDGADSA